MNHPLHHLDSLRDAARRAAEQDSAGSRTELEQRLARLLRAPGDLLAGRVNVVNLDPVRDLLGSQWPALQLTVHKFMRTAIDGCIGPGDVVARFGVLQFVILFTDRDDARSKAVCAHLERQIARFLQALDGAGRRLQVTTAVGTINGALLVQLLEAAAPGGPLELADADQPDEAAQQDSGFRYIAMWDVRRKAINTFACFRQVRDASGAIRLGYQAFENPADLRFVADTDMLTLSCAARDAGRLLAAGARALVVSSVHVATLDKKPTRDWYLSTCATLSQQVREHLLIELVGLPAAAPSTRISHAIAWLRPHCRAIVLRRPLADLSMTHLRACGVSSVTVVLESARSAEARLAPQLRRFAAAAETAGLRAIVDGVATTSLALNCIGHGFSFVNGPVVGPTLLGPTAARQFELEDLYRSDTMGGQRA